MKLIIDAQLPVKLAVALTAAGHDAVHTLNLPDKNRSSDSYIARLAGSEGRVVISKDADFVTSHIVHGSPHFAYCRYLRGTCQTRLCYHSFWAILTGLQWPSSLSLTWS